MFKFIIFLFEKIFYKRCSYFRHRAFKNYLDVKKHLGDQKIIKVAFLVSNPSKWQYQSLYDSFKENPKYEPVILVTLPQAEYKNPKQDLASLINNVASFFTSQGMKTKFAFNCEKNKFIDLNEFGPNLVFYQEPWDLNFVQHPYSVSKFALTYYFPYGFQIIFFEASYTKKFHSFIYNMFIEDRLHIKSYQETGNFSDNCVVVGNPKLDVYLDPIATKVETLWRYPSKFKIIYAPHHSFEGDMLETATFRWSGQKIIELLKTYADRCDWVLKPHPLFKTALLKHKIMKVSEIDDFYETWKSNGSIYETGNYFDLFRTSDLLITDCISFLGEYAPTLNPVIHLTKSDKYFNDFGLSIINQYYRVYNVDELVAVFNDVAVQKNDYMNNNRKDKIGLIFSEQERASNKIIDHITKDIVIAKQ